MKYKKIQNLEQYNTYCDLHEKLGIKDDVKYRDDLDLLEILIDEYDNRQADYDHSLSPVELLRSILDEEQISHAELARDLGTSRQLISDILRHRRTISKVMVNKLSSRFAMRPQAFAREYALSV